MNKAVFFIAALSVAAIAVSFRYQSITNPQKTGKTPVHKRDIERGKYLAYHVAGCMDCHSQRDFTKFSGPPKPGTEGMGGERFGPEYGLPGQVYARNITPAALGNWTDQEILTAMTRGISKNGDTLFPLMPYLAFSKMSRDDLEDIIGFIRTLKPINNTPPKRQLFIPIAMAIPPQLPNPDLSKNIRPDASDKVNYGKYLVTMGSCSDCHTPMEKGQFNFARYLGGGRSFVNPTFTVSSANITPDTTGGIGAWSEAAFLAKFRTNAHEKNVAMNPGKFNTMMPWSLFGMMKDEDLKAVYAYLRTVKPIREKVLPWGAVTTKP